MFLLQATPPLQEPEKQTFWDILVSGGITMIPIAILFVLAIYLIIERYLNIRRADQVDQQAFMATVRSYVLSGNIEEAKNYCMRENTPFARMVLKGIKRLGSPVGEINSAIESVGNLEIYRLEKRMGILASVAGAGPMLGFFGTVLGMIEAFMKVAAASKTSGQVNPADLADPISVALVTTAAGLVVGLIAYLGYNTLVNQVGSVVHKMENTTTEFIDLLAEPVK